MTQSSGDLTTWSCSQAEESRTCTSSMILPGRSMTQPQPSCLKRLGWRRNECMLTRTHQDHFSTDSPTRKPQAASLVGLSHWSLGGHTVMLQLCGRVVRVHNYRYITPVQVLHLLQYKMYTTTRTVLYSTLPVLVARRRVLQYCVFICQVVLVLRSTGVPGILSTVVLSMEYGG